MDGMMTMSNDLIAGYPVVRDAPEAGEVAPEAGEVASAETSEVAPAETGIDPTQAAFLDGNGNIVRGDE